ncbi:MAG: hypothetical protein IIC20_04865 [Chloroflexi bacterium]|nr:hypothetical protein [Chloroflexota bacterium]
MPITRRQFELSITPAIEGWMETLYEHLRRNKDQAYTMDDLVEHFGIALEPDDLGLVRGAVEKLVALGAFEARTLQGQTYYAFEQQVKKGTWELDYGPIDV